KQETKMALSQRLFSDALRDMQRAMAVFDQPLFSPMFNSEVSPFFGNQGNRGHNSNNNSVFGRYPATDIIEKPEFYELHAEIPGYDKKDIKIEVNDGRTLILSGTMKKEHHEGPALEEEQKAQENKASSTASGADGATAEGQQVVQKKDQDSQVAQYNNSPKWWVNERVAGSFTRSFNFPNPIDAEQIKASYQDGILKVIIPKSNKNQSRFVNIE
ncbi:hypothetical protein CU098_004125, partial [Rhizopus stolonifer]